MPMAIALAVRHCGLTVAEAIVATTVNAAAVLSKPDRGGITTGSRADLILLHERDERTLGYAFGDNPIAMVFKDGKPIGPC